MASFIVHAARTNLFEYNSGMKIIDENISTIKSITGEEEPYYERSLILITWMNFT